MPNKKKPKRKRKPAWRAIVPGGKILPSMTFDELRVMKESHRLLTQEFKGPPAIGRSIRAFRMLQLFGAACAVEGKHPALTRCTKELDALFGKDAAFAEGLFVPSWVLMNFPCGPGELTALDHFESFLDGTSQLERVRPFIEAARASRLGLYQTVLRSTELARFRELFTDRVIDMTPQFDAGEPGEIVLGRLMVLDGQTYFWGGVKIFPPSALQMVQNMVLDKLLALDWVDYAQSGSELTPSYEKFMRLAGPYWMSVVATNEELPVLDPDHYLSYLDADAASGPDAET